MDMRRDRSLNKGRSANRSKKTGGLGVWVHISVMGMDCSKF